MQKDSRTKRVLVVGWDAADWKLLQPLLDAGEMPALKGLIDRGVSGKIATLNPPFSPMLWTSVATGKRPDKHGILNFVEPAPTGGIRPVSVTSRKCRALWNILQTQGMKSNLVSWWPTHPAEPISGVVVSDNFQKANNEVDKAWPMPKGTVHPPSLAESLKELRIHPSELSAAHVLPFIPDPQNVEGKELQLIKNFANVLAQTATVQAASTHLMRTTDWDFMGVYFDGIDHFCHGFVRYHPPQLEGISDELFNRYKDVVNGGYRFHDMMLERMLKLAGPDTTVIVMSDHGFQSDHLRLRRTPKFNAGPAMEHAPYGMVVMAGPGIAKGEQLFGASLLDIAPTILRLMGLPVGEDMDGKVLEQVFEKPVEVATIPSWEDVPGEDGMHPEGMQQDPVEAALAMEQLVALGYVEDPGENANAASKKGRDDIQYNLALVHKGAGQIEKAYQILKDLVLEDPEEFRYTLELIVVALRLNHVREARNYMDILEELDKAKLTNRPLLSAKLMVAENRIVPALQLLEEVERARPRMPNLHLELGKVYLNLHRFESALQAFEKALDIDNDSAEAQVGMAKSHFGLQKYEEAASCCLEATAKLFHFPAAHYVLGMSLRALELNENALEAFHLVLNQNPKHLRARKASLELMRELGVPQEKIATLELQLKQQIKGELTLVSALPNNNSLELAQSIAEWSERRLEVLDLTLNAQETEAHLKRFAEESNPPVVHLEATQLKTIPQRYLFKLVWIERDLSEAIKAFSEAKGQPSVFPSGAARVFEKEVERLEVQERSNPTLSVLRLPYKEWVENPDSLKGIVLNFL